MTEERSDNSSEFERGYRLGYEAAEAAALEAEPGNMILPANDLLIHDLRGLVDEARAERDIAQQNFEESARQFYEIKTRAEQAEKERDEWPRVAAEMVAQGGRRYLAEIAELGARVAALETALKECKVIAEMSNVDEPVFVLPNKIAACVDAALREQK